MEWASIKRGDSGSRLQSYAIVVKKSITADAGILRVAETRPPSSAMTPFQDQVELRAKPCCVPYRRLAVKKPLRIYLGQLDVFSMRGGAEAGKNNGHTASDGFAAVAEGSG